METLEEVAGQEVFELERELGANAASGIVGEEGVEGRKVEAEFCRKLVECFIVAELDFAVLRRV